MTETNHNIMVFAETEQLAFPSVAGRRGYTALSSAATKVHSQFRLRGVNLPLP